MTKILKPIPPFGRLAACLLVGAAAGTALDGIHAYGDTLWYPETAFGRWAWFVPVEFGLLGLAIGVTMPALERIACNGRSIRWTLEEHLGDLILFPALYLTTTLVGGESEAVWLAAVLLGIAALRLVLKPTPGDWLYVLLLGVCGPLAEWILAATGAFHYTNPDFLNIPYWLPGLWANGAFFIRRLFYPIVLGRPRMPAP